MRTAPLFCMWRLLESQTFDVSRRFQMKVREAGIYKIILTIICCNKQVDGRDSGYSPFFLNTLLTPFRGELRM